MYPVVNTVTNEHQPRVSLHWRIAIVFIASMAIWLLIGQVANRLFGADYSRTGHVVRAVLTSLLVVPFIIWACRFLDRRPWGELGLTSIRTGWRPLLVGMVCWLIPAAIGTILCFALGWTQITPQAPVTEIVGFTLLLVVLVFLYEALPEELIFRGYFYRNLAEKMPVWVAVVVQAVLFTVFGFILAIVSDRLSPDRMLLFFAFGIVNGIFRAVTGSVWTSIGFHTVFQTAAQLMGDVGGYFAITNPDPLTVFAFGALPFGFGMTLLGMFYKHRTLWRSRESGVKTGSAFNPARLTSQVQ